MKTKLIVLVCALCALVSHAQTNHQPSSVTNIVVVTNGTQVTLSATISLSDFQAMAHWAATPRTDLTDPLTRVPTNGVEVVAAVMGRNIASGRRHLKQSEQNADIQKFARRLKTASPEQLQQMELLLRRNNTNISAIHNNP